VSRAADAAALLLEKQCSGGDATACTALGMAYTFGEHVTKDPQRGVPLLERACRSQNDEVAPRACFHLGEAYRAGEQDATDLQRAKE
jgi:TPR repeat protein